MNPDKTEGAVAVVILAAGKGTRMNSDKAKVLHPVAGRPMLLYVVDAATRIAGKEVVVVVGTQAETVRDVVAAHANVGFADQERQLGTGHAAICAMPALADHVRHVVFLCGDVPLITPDTLQRLIDTHVGQKLDVTILGARLENPAGYGRLKQKSDGTVASIVEEADASAAEKAINTVNTGIYCVARDFLEDALTRIRTDNAQAEMYLTDIVGIAAGDGKRVGLMLCADQNEMRGINSPADLEKVEAIIHRNEKP
ncbi:MAG: NTP transferase domain-containing protein [Desulfobacterales bacterium]|nr:NTP transferase domain-containing protein [Desulfobacterales bacterium]